MAFATKSLTTNWAREMASDMEFNTQFNWQARLFIFAASARAFVEEMNTPPLPEYQTKRHQALNTFWNYSCLARNDPSFREAISEGLRVGLFNTIGDLLMKIPSPDMPFNDTRDIALFFIYDFFREEPDFTRLITDAVEASFASIAMQGNTETAMRKMETLKSRPALYKAAMRSIVNDMKRQESLQLPQRE